MHQTKLPARIPPRPTGRFLAIATAMGAALLAGPASSAVATPRSVPIRVNPDSTRETVEQRIDRLHRALKITSEQEPAWKTVAQVMRDNEAAMRRVSAEHSKAAGHIATAVEELRTYEAFSQAHVSGLKVLIDAFEVLYNSMSDTQKVNADSVFRKFGRRPHRAES